MRTLLLAAKDGPATTLTSDSAIAIALSRRGEARLSGSLLARQRVAESGVATTGIASLRRNDQGQRTRVGCGRLHGLKIARRHLYDETCRAARARRAGRICR